MRDHPVWVLVADAHRARVLQRAAMDAPWEELAEEGTTAQVPPSRELGTDRPGRSHESVGMARHAIAPRQDLHDAAEAAFARDLGEWLEAAAQAGRYRRLYVIAPPRFLGVLRGALGARAAQVLRGTLDKDLAEAPVAAVIEHLRQHRPAMH